MARRRKRQNDENLDFPDRVAATHRFVSYPRPSRRETKKDQYL